MDKPSTIRQPQQLRSQRTLDRILAAAREVVAEEGFEAASITEITTRAGVAVGTFYTRFENKDALLHALHEQQTSVARDRIRDELTPARRSEQSVREILDELVRGSMELTRSITGFQRACYQRALTDPVFAGREVEVRRELARRLKTLLSESDSAIGHPDPERAIEFCSELYVAVITEHIIAEAFSASRLSDDEVIRELVDAMCAYLRVDRA